MKFLIMILSILSFASCSKDKDDFEAQAPTQLSESILIFVDSTVFTASVYDNATAMAFKELLPLTLDMQEMNTNEKYASLPNALPSGASKFDVIESGDLMLYGSNTLVLFYKTFSSGYNYTKIASVDNPSGLQTALGKGNIMVKFQLN